MFWNTPFLVMDAHGAAGKGSAVPLLGVWGMEDAQMDPRKREEHSAVHRAAERS